MGGGGVRSIEVAGSVELCSSFPFFRGKKEKKMWQIYALVFSRGRGSCPGVVCFSRGIVKRGIK